jgi:hypothetical protein
MRMVLLLACCGVVAVLACLTFRCLMASDRTATAPVVNPAPTLTTPAESETYPVTAQEMDVSPVEAPAFLTATGDEAVGPDTEGVVVDAVTSDLPGEVAGVQRGDQLLAVNGMRVHGVAEVALVAGLLPVGHDREHWSLRRGAVVIETDLADLQAAGGAGVKLVAGPPGVARAFHDAGLADGVVSAAELDLLPPRVGHAVARWHSAHADALAPAWLGHFAADWHAMRQGSALAGSAAEMPVPLLADIERYWHLLAADQPQDPPSPTRWRCDAAFAAEFFPYTSTDLLFGAPAIADADLVAHVRATFDNAEAADAERQYGMDIVSHLDGQGPTDQFISGCAAALVSPEEQGGWPYRSSLIDAKADCAAIVAELQRRLAAGGGDADLLRFALIGPLVTLHQDDNVRSLIKDIGAHSQYLALRARDTAREAEAFSFHGSVLMQMPYCNAFACAYGVAHPPHGIMYPWVIARSFGLRNFLGGDAWAPAAIGHVPDAFRARPDLVMAAFRPNADVVDANAQAMTDWLRQSDAVLFTLAADPAVADGAQAVILADMMEHCSVALSIQDRDAIAAAYARAGNFTRAVAWERGAAAGAEGEPSQADFMTRLGLYASHQAYAVNDHARGAAVSEPSADGTLTCIGQCADGIAVGPWRFIHPDGKLQYSGGYNAHGLPEGIWRSYGADGKPRIEAGFRNGRRCGHFRAWNDAGKLVVEGWYYQGEENIPLRFGMWTWYNEDGTRHEAGRFIDNHREGTWILWNPAGEVAATTHFIDDHADGPWPENAIPTMPPYTPPVAPLPTGGP